MNTLFRGLTCFLLAAPFCATWAAHKPAPPPRAKTEVLTCRSGSEDRHARIAVVLVGGKMDSFAYYSKWKPRTCSIYLQRTRDAYSRWRDKGNLTTVDVERGHFIIEHRKGEYRFVFRDIDRERYCGMDGSINGTLTIRKGSERCEIAGIMEEGIPLGQAYAHLEEARSDGAVGATPSTSGVSVAAASRTAAPALASGGSTAAPPSAAGMRRSVGGSAAAAPWYVRWWRSARAQQSGPQWPVARGD